MDASRDRAGWPGSGPRAMNIKAGCPTKRHSQLFRPFPLPTQKGNKVTQYQPANSDPVSPVSSPAIQLNPYPDNAVPRLSPHAAFPVPASERLPQSRPYPSVMNLPKCPTQFLQGHNQRRHSSKKRELGGGGGGNGPQMSPVVEPSELKTRPDHEVPCRSLIQPQSTQINTQVEHHHLPGHSRWSHSQNSNPRRQSHDPGRRRPAQEVVFLWQRPRVQVEC